MPIKKSILNSLKKNESNLTKLKIGITELNYEPICSQDLVELANALSDNKYLSVLEINWSGTSIHHKIEEKGLTVFATLISQLSTIQELSFIYTGLKGNQVKSLCLALANNKSITSLNLVGNHVDAEAAIGISKLLENNFTLTFLNLTNCEIKDEGAAIFSEGLSLNKSIKILQLSNNFRIGDIGVETIAKALILNKTLTKLDLTNASKVGDRGCIAMAKALTQNNTLQSLIFQYTNITDVSLREFAIMLRCNFNIIQFSIDRHNFTPSLKPIQKPISDLSSSEIRNLIGEFLVRNKKISEEKNPIRKANIIGKFMGQYQVPTLLNITMWAVKKLSQEELKKIDEIDIPRDIINYLKQK